MKDCASKSCFVEPCEEQRKSLTPPPSFDIPNLPEIAEKFRKDMCDEDAPVEMLVDQFLADINFTDNEIEHIFQQTV